MIPGPDPTLPDVGVTAKRVFELFVETLEKERDVADDVLLTRLRWYAKDAEASAERLADAPRAARSLVSNLADLIRGLETEAAKIDVLEENLHQARRWALLLPEISILSD